MPANATTQDIFSVTLGAGLMTLNDRPIEPAALQQAFETAWNDYAAARAKNKLPPTLSLQVDEKEPVKRPLELLAHARKTKECVVRLTAPPRKSTAGDESLERPVIEMSIGDEEDFRNSHGNELIPVDCHPTSSGLIARIVLNNSAVLQPKRPGDAKFLRDISDYLSLRQAEAKAAGQDVPRVELIVDDALLGAEFIELSAAVAMHRADGKWIPYEGFISPRLTSQPSLDPEEQLEHRIFSSTPLTPANSVANPGTSNKPNPPTSNPSRP
jgi:hypothetical protein